MKLDNSSNHIQSSEDENLLFQPSHNNKRCHGMNVRQLTWALFLRAHAAAYGMARFAAASWALPQGIKRRLVGSSMLRGGGGTVTAAASGETDQVDKGEGDTLLQFFRGFLGVCLVTLAFELVGYWNGWSSTTSGGDLQLLSRGRRVDAAYLAWISVRANYVARPLQAVCKVCVVVFVMQSVGWLVFCLGYLWIKFNKISPALRSKGMGASGSGDLLLERSDDQLGCSSWYPMVLIQIPMCNEREVYEQSISAACQLDWPKDRFLVQILDDSDDKEIQLMIRAEVAKWSSSGTNIIYRHRLVRTGYKAGNLKFAMSCDYVKDYQFVAIFDADFQPNPDFLKRTIRYFKDNPELGVVQARLTLTNKDQNLLTRLQHISCCYYFEVEQQVHGVFFDFSMFIGTAAVWRIQALEGSGGWLDRTTVEDTDVALRAHLQEWKFIYLNDVKVHCETPEFYEDYRKQQHRWHSGPLTLFRLCLPDIITSKISIWKKSFIILAFFLFKKVILPLNSFLMVCIILPLTMFVPEAEIPIWVIFCIPLLMSVFTVYPALGPSPFALPYLFLENTMSVPNFNAMISGLLQLRNSNEWAVTKKTGRSGAPDHSGPGTVPSSIPRLQRDSGIVSAADTVEVTELNRLKEGEPMLTQSNKIYKQELTLALLLLAAAFRGLLSAHAAHFYFLLFQGVAFLVVGLDLIGGQITS